MKETERAILLIHHYVFSVSLWLILCLCSSLLEAQCPCTRRRFGTPTNWQAACEQLGLKSHKL